MKMATIDTITDIAVLGLTVGVAGLAFSAFNPGKKKKNSKKSMNFFS